MLRCASCKVALTTEFPAKVRGRSGAGSNSATMGMMGSMWNFLWFGLASLKKQSAASLIIQLYCILVAHLLDQSNVLR